MAMASSLWEGQANNGVKPKALTAYFATMLLLALGLVVERYDRVSRHDETEEFVGRAERIPNYRHVWFAHEMIDANTRRKDFLNTFGQDVQQTGGDWSVLCRMDSDGDNLTNGQELGDPCCRFMTQPGASFAVESHREYRRWLLSHPGRKEVHAQPARSDIEPASCSDQDYDAERYTNQFRSFYFSRLHEETRDTPPPALVVIKLVALGCLFLQLGYWVVRQGLADDVCPWLASMLSIRTRVAIMAAAFVYMDLTSGIIHLILDYAPQFLPGLGGLSRGFQYHHHDPTAILRISWYTYVSHMHLLLPVVSLLLFLGNASRPLRLFWFWGGIWAHLFQTAHRWAHFPPETLPWLVQVLQNCGLILSHERHMNHHQDLETQFTILSGHTDIVLDAVARVLPAAHYDVWCVLGVCWFFLPTVLDVWSQSGIKSGVSPLEDQNKDHSV